MELSITPDRLRSLAGYAFSRGEMYFRDGRVVSSTIDGDALVGVVHGTHPYQVRVTMRGGAFRTSCTCPVAFLCKHAVALVLHHLDAHPRATPARAEVPGTFASWAEVTAFARARGIEHVLATSATLINPHLDAPRDYWRTHVLPRLTVAEVATLEATRARGIGHYLQIAVARAAYLALHDAAEAVEIAEAEEAGRPERAPLPETAAVWEALLAVRARLRAHATPRPRGALAGGAWSVERDEPVIEWREPHRVRHPDGFGTVDGRVRLAFDDLAAPELACTCSRVDVRCTHALALIDVTLDRLADPEHADDARALARHLLQPRWARALDELARLEAEPAPPIELWWHVEHREVAIDLIPVVKRITKRGQLTRGARFDPLALLAEHGGHLDDRDRAIAEALAGWMPHQEAAYPARAFAALVGHPRVVAGRDSEPVEIARGQLGFRIVAADAQLRIEPEVAPAGGGEPRPLSPELLGALFELHPAFEPLLVFEPGRCTVVEVKPAARRVWHVFTRHGATFPPESHHALLDRLARLDGNVPVTVPRAIKGDEVAADPVVVLRVRLLPGATPALEVEPHIRPAPGAPLVRPCDGPDEILIVDAARGRRGFVRRDLDAERALVDEALTPLPVGRAIEGPPGCLRIDDPDDALAIVAALPALPDGVEAEWVDDRRLHVRRAASADALRVKIDRQRDWFGIAGDLRVDDTRVEIALVLDAARRQRRYVRVDDERWVELSEQLTQRLAAVADQAYPVGDRVELSPGAIPAIDALAEAGAKVDVAVAWRELAARMHAARGMRPRPPRTLRAKLRDYQLEGHAWMTRVAAWGAGAVLADDMGLGKTIQAIAVLLDRGKHGPALVLAPTSVTLNWVDELKRFAPSLKPIVYAELPDRAAAVATLGPRDVVIASYGLLAREPGVLGGAAFATLVADEAQALKNPATRRAKAARGLRAEFRLALTGTPLENHLGELWSLFAVIFPGLLGSWDRFRDRFAVPIEKHGDPDARAALARVVRPFLLRRTKAEVARELPPRTEIDVPVALSDAERALYDDARLAAITELESDRGRRVADERKRFQILAALTRLRLLACHPRLHDASSKVDSSKLARALELLAELRAGGHRALVFSQFTSHLALVRDELDDAGVAYQYLDGATPAKQRAQRIAAFQRGDGDVFLISLKAGGQGINLTAADYVLHLDPWWNPAVEDQATDRAHRIGQDRPVTVYRLIARDTIEDRIRALHDDKRALVAGVLEGTGAAARLSTGDLLSLLAET